MSSRDRLAAVLAPDVVDAIEHLIAERVEAELGAIRCDDGPTWLSLEQAAKRAGVSERSLERAIRSGRLRSSTVGRRRLVHRDDLDAYVRGDGRGDAPAAPSRRLGGV